MQTEPNESKRWQSAPNVCLRSNNFALFWSCLAKTPKRSRPNGSKRRVQIETPPKQMAPIANELKRKRYQTEVSSFVVKAMQTIQRKRLSPPNAPKSIGFKRADGHKRSQKHPNQTVPNEERSQSHANAQTHQRQRWRRDTRALEPQISCTQVMEPATAALILDHAAYLRDTMSPVHPSKRHCHRDTCPIAP